eukprot:TRINITY_DN758_c0_g2_i1.p1 TRINITY_DN758_c0_g2~~TRINITY_DN758_c0_g2_i1.p1  ORF type:complete len:1189 (+),score=161.77 TRINITY_DN758_c0_g2_i1:44-3610(+)
MEQALHSFGGCSSKLLLPDDVLRRVFAKLDLADVTLFALTSKQSRKVAVTNFVTSIDMWSLTQFPVDTLLQGFKSLIADVPASDLREITSWRMPRQGDYSTSLAFAEPILCNLTSLHALEPTKAKDIENSRMDFVLEQCTSLKQLYYATNYSMAFEKYLGRQPQLQALAVRVITEDKALASRLCERVVSLFEKLEHRPETVCILTVNEGDSLSRHPGWARDAKRVILHASLPSRRHYTIQENIEWFSKSFGAPPIICSKLKSLRDPFSEDALPYIADIIKISDLISVGTDEYIFDTILAHVSPDVPIRVFAAAIHHVFMLLGVSSSSLAMGLVMSVVIHAGSITNKARGLELFLWLPVVTRGLPVPEPLQDETLQLREVEYQLDRLESMCILEPFESAPSARESIAEYYKVPLVAACLFTGNSAPMFSAEGRPQAKKLLSHLVAKGNFEELLEIWNRFPNIISLVPTLHIPRELLNGVTLSTAAILELINQPKKFGFTLEELLLRSDVEQCLVEVLCDSEHLYPLQIASSMLKCLVSSPRIVARLHRRARVFPACLPTIAAWMYSFVFTFDELPGGKILKDYLDQQLVKRAKDADEPIKNFWQFSRRGLWSRATFLANFITYKGMPNELHHVWDVLVCTDTAFRSDLAQGVTKYSFDHDPRLPQAPTLLEILCQMVPQEFVDPERLCKMYFVRHADLTNVEEVAPTDVPLDSPWAPLLVDKLLQKWLKHLSGAYATRPFPRAAKEIMKWCSKPRLAEIVAEHLPDVVWIDPHAGKVTQFGNKTGSTLLSALISRGFLESAFVLMHKRSDNCFPLYAMDLAYLEPYADNIVLCAFLLSHCNRHTGNPNNFLHVLDKLVSCKIDIPNEIKNGLWMFFVGARSGMTGQTFATVKQWDPRHLRLLLRMSTDVMTQLRGSIDANIVTAYLCLMAAQNNWDGFLGSAVYLQKQQYPSAHIQTVLVVAIMVAFYNMGTVEKAKKAAAKLDPHIGTAGIFSFLGAEKIWEQLKKQTAPASIILVSSPSSSSSSAAPSKKKKGKSKKSSNSKQAPHAASSSFQSSASIEEDRVSNTPPEEAAEHYEPDTKPVSGIQAAPAVSDVPSISDSSNSSMTTSSQSASKDAPVMCDRHAVSPAGMIYAACPICYDCLPDCVIIDCGHTFCLSCIRNLSKCSICRQPINQWRRFFYSQGEPDI